MNQMTQSHQEIVFLFLQFCKEENLTATARVLERESGVYFDIDHFEELVCSGNWNGVEKYLSGYGTPDENRYFLKIYFEVRKQKLLEALDMGDDVKALEIVKKEMKVFASHDPELFKEITQLLALDDFRQHKSLSSYTDSYSERKLLSKRLRSIIEKAPSFRGKLEFPDMGMARIRHLVNQSLNWQHAICKYPKADPDIKTLLKDHVCEQHERSVERSIETLQTEADNHTATLEAVYTGSSERSDETSDTVENSPGTETDVENQKVEQPAQGSKHVDLPKTICSVIKENSRPTSMDFHPMNDSILLVGTDSGDIALWDTTLRKILFSKSFNVWDKDNRAYSMAFKTAFVSDPHVSVNRAAWSPGGQLIGVAYSKNIVQLYTFQGEDVVLPSLEIEAHAGSVTDIAFAKPDKDIVVITCGEDKLVKVWDALTGASKYVFDDHKAAVTCVCPREIKGVHFVFSTTATGEMRGRMYDKRGYRIRVDDQFCRPMVCTKDGKRIFSYGINKEEQPCIREWDDDEHCMKNSYRGLKKPLPGVVHFDTAENHILAAGDDHQIKFWDMSNLDLFSSTDAGGDLPVYPYVRFCKDGMFLAVSAKENKIVILATTRGLEVFEARRKDVKDMVVEPTSNAFITPAVSDTSACALQNEDEGVIMGITIEDELYFR